MPVHRDASCPRLPLILHSVRRDLPTESTNSVAVNVSTTRQGPVPVNRCGSARPLWRWTALSFSRGGLAVRQLTATVGDRQRQLFRRAIINNVMRLDRFTAIDAVVAGSNRLASYVDNDKI